MSQVYTVQRGDDLFTIAQRFGFRDFRTIYLDANNANLRLARPNPTVLFPGDTVVIPDRDSRSESASTGHRHVFFSRRMNRMLTLRLLDPFGVPFANEPYDLVIDGQISTTGATTDGSGVLREEISPDARTGRVSLHRYFWEFEIGALDPLNDVSDGGISGAQGRLLNLGYYAGEPDGILGPQTAAALRRFQADNALPVTGMLDGETKRTLIKLHGA